MKKLNLREMEELEGGNWSCVAGVAGLALTALALTAAGPFGWVAWTVGIGRAFLTGGSLGKYAYDLAS